MTSQMGAVASVGDDGEADESVVDGQALAGDALAAEPVLGAETDAGRGLLIAYALL